MKALISALSFFAVVISLIAATQLVRAGNFEAETLANFSDTRCP